MNDEFGRRVTRVFLTPIFSPNSLAAHDIPCATPAFSIKRQYYDVERYEHSLIDGLL